MNEGQNEELIWEFVRYFEPADLFYHLRLEAHLVQFGFEVISIERLSSSSAWRIKLKATIKVQAQLLGPTYRARCLHFRKTQKQVVGWLKLELRSLLKQWGQGIEGERISVARHGIHFRVRFAWPLGTPGVWRPSSRTSRPYLTSAMIEDWLKTHSN